MRSSQSLTVDKVKSLKQYNHVSNYITYLEDLSTSVQQYYTDLSDSYINKFVTYTKSNPTLLLSVSYGILTLGFILIFLFEILYFCKRRLRLFRGFVNGLWCTCSIITICFSLFLNVLVPVIGSMAELSSILEPSLYNKTFYGKMEFPTDLVKGHLYPCIYGSMSSPDIGGNLHDAATPISGSLRQAEKLYNTMKFVASGSVDRVVGFLIYLECGS